MTSHLTIEHFKNAELLSSNTVMSLNELTDIEKRQVEIVLDEEWNYLDEQCNETEHDYTKLFRDGVGLAEEHGGAFMIDIWQVGDVIFRDLYHFPNNGDTQVGAIFLEDSTNRIAIISDAQVYCVDNDPNSLTEEQVNAFMATRRDPD